MSFLMALASIMAYLVAPPAGVFVVVCTIVFVAAKKGRTKLEKTLTLLVLTMPLYMLPVIPGLHHIASWTTILTLALIGLLAANLRRFSPIMAILLLILVSFSVLTGMSTAEGIEGWYYLVTFLLLVVPIVLVYEARDWVREQLDADSVNRLLTTLAGVQLALAVGVLIQWQVHTRLGIIIGEIGFFNVRVTYDLTISAYSVLSGLLAVGIVLAPTLWRRGRWKMAILLAAVSGFAIVINSSRTGLVVGVAVLGLSLLFPPRGVRRIGARLAIIPAAGLAWWLFDSYESSARGSMATGLFDENGRFETFDRAFRQLFANDMTAIIGLGYADYKGVPPHNFIVETMASSGVVTAAIVVLLAAGMLIYLRGSEWQYPVWALLGSSMLFSGFYAVKGAMVIAVLMIAFRAAESAVNTEGPQAHRPAKVGKPGGSHLYVPLHTHGGRRP
ncbi:hypothetical protein [Microbacterium sp. NPDC087592]|uniref:hypothetical protein n=1 Tax=Microbacterium sp. NPDC087592 TaxID=3364193 RepID=UPI0038016153